MTIAVGCLALRLVRVAIGPVTLKGLQPGESRQLAPDEVAAFTRIEPYRSPDSMPRSSGHGRTDSAKPPFGIDALAEDGERWALEVKWRQKRVGRSELDQLLADAISRQASRPGDVELVCGLWHT